MGNRLPSREVRLAAGTGFVLALAEGISLMPACPVIRMLAELMSTQMAASSD